MKATIEYRYEEGGFVYVGRTRLLFARRSILREPRPDGVNSIWLCSANNWPEPTKQEAEAAYLALEKAFPGEVG